MASELTYRGGGGASPGAGAGGYSDSPKPSKPLAWLPRAARYAAAEHRPIFTLAGMLVAAAVFSIAAPSGSSPSGYSAGAAVESYSSTNNHNNPLARFSVEPAHRGVAVRHFVGGKVPLGLKRKGLRVLVTGGAGFVGSHLVDRLLERGDSVIVVDNLFTRRKEFVRDLSFNKLSGEIPASFSNMGRVDYIYLTGNSLSGNIPGWLLRRNNIADISINNFTLGSSGPSQCLQGSINLVESYSPEMNSLNSVQPCLKRNFPCASSNGQYRSSLHINCGDKEATINGIKYEADMTPKGASELYVSPGSNWAFSSTGNFLDNNINDDNYIAASASKLTMPNSELYAKARLSPLSLTYYGLCMFSGSYTVKLHFAEIVFTNDSTYCSLGKRRFNVFIQGRMVLEDFDIEQSSGAAGKPVIKTFQTYVKNHTLEIQFYWAGRGTTGIPDRGSYGPLISAISVTPSYR